MEPPYENERLIRRYLLGDVTAEEQREIEQRLFSDEHSLAQANRIENELIDEYVSGELTGESKSQFERHFMNAPDRRESVVFARALNSYVSAKADPDSSLNVVSSSLKRSRFHLLPAVTTRAPFILQASLVIVAAVFCTLLVWMFLDRVQLRTQLEQARIAQGELEKREENLRGEIDEQRSRSEKLAKDLEFEKETLADITRELNTLRPRNTRQIEADLNAVVLFPGLSRGQEGTATVTLLAGQINIRLALMLGKERYERYKATVIAVEGGEEIQSQDHLRGIKTRNGITVVVTLPAAKLTLSDYRVELHGVVDNRLYEKAGSYHFRVLRR